MADDTSGMFGSRKATLVIGGLVLISTLIAIAVAFGLISGTRKVQQVVEIQKIDAQKAAEEATGIPMPTTPQEAAKAVPARRPLTPADEKSPGYIAQQIRENGDVSLKPGAVHGYNAECTTEAHVFITGTVVDSKGVVITDDPKDMNIVIVQTRDGKTAEVDAKKAKCMFSAF